MYIIVKINRFICQLHLTVDTTFFNQNYFVIKQMYRCPADLVLAVQTLLTQMQIDHTAFCSLKFRFPTSTPKSV